MEVLSFSRKSAGPDVNEGVLLITDLLLLDVPHRQIVFTIPKRLRVFFKFDRRLLGDLCRCALRSLSCYFEAAALPVLMETMTP
ncbi:MAG: hypothetical protein IMZ61_13395 [Planctomycetes bacterium]|nr:hypothetical protein [Planctomycetota bacterium]